MSMCGRRNNTSNAIKMKQYENMKVINVLEYISTKAIDNIHFYRIEQIWLEKY